jgi:hypothetical protein
MSAWEAMGRERSSQPSAQAVPDPPGEVRDLAAAAPQGVHDRRGRPGGRRRSRDDREAAHGGQAGGTLRPGRLPARSSPQRGRPRAGRRQGGDRAPIQGAHRDGRAPHAAGGKRTLGLNGGRVLRRVDAATKAGLLELIDRAMNDGWSHRRACRVLELREVRAWWPHPGRRSPPGGQGPRRPPRPRPACRGGGRDRGGLRGVGRSRPLAPQARPPRFVPGAGLGLALQR